MKKSDIYEITIKIFGLYLFFTSLGLFNSIIIRYFTYLELNNPPISSENISPKTFFYIEIAHLCLVLIFASFLTFKTKTIVRFVCGKSDFEETSTLFADRKTIFEIALVIMGLFLVIWTFPNFVLELKNHLFKKQLLDPSQENETTYFFISIFKIIVGLIAVFYSKSIAKFIAKETIEEVN